MVLSLQSTRTGVPVASAITPSSRSKAFCLFYAQLLAVSSFLFSLWAILFILLDLHVCVRARSVRTSLSFILKGWSVHRFCLWCRSFCSTFFPHPPLSRIGRAVTVAREVVWGRLTIWVWERHFSKHGTHAERKVQWSARARVLLLFQYIFKLFLISYIIIMIIISSSNSFLFQKG